MSITREDLVAIIASARTDVGGVRKHNEDAYLLHEVASWESSSARAVGHMHAPNEPLFLMVSDGMGGAAAGEVASRIAVETVRERLVRNELAPDRIAADLGRALEAANSGIHHQSRTTTGQSGMGATATVVVVHAGTAYLGQVGDSRGYLLRSRVLQQITQDQSLVGMLQETGQITPEGARSHPQRHALLQALGPSETVTPTLATVELCRGDRLLLCSDGLTGCIEDDEIERVVDSIAEPAAAVDELIRFANARGADDNVTVLIADVHSRDLPAPDGGPAVLDSIQAYRLGASSEKVPRWKKYLLRISRIFK